MTAPSIEPFSLPLSRPLETAGGTIETRRGFRIRIEIDGTPGVGEATPLSGWTESLDACESALRSVDDPVSALRGDQLRGTRAARHGVSLAVIDARARKAGLPLYRYLGARERVESVPANATVGDGSSVETADAACAAVRAGYPAVKVKIGAQAPAVDVERLESVRSTCPDVELRVDANGAWDETTADRLLPTLADLDIAVVEQPLSADRLREHSRLRDRGVEIALDESLVEHGVEAVIDAEAADVLVCKPMALGGIDVARDVIETARTAGLDGLVTTTIDGSIARAAAVHLAASVRGIRPCGLATGDLLAEDLTESIESVEEGAIAVPQGKGNIPPR
ncbi:MAG: mandelate racemase/muconate lactonizing enzyme family protein [Halobacteriota archaeon]|uniref:mandelate racemase/muconate lactonizing enzyme family protein n=1 Tax=Natronomonas sp. TaxID=2184060 RepID=UPI003974ACB6